MTLPFDDTLSLPIIFAWLRGNLGKIVIGGIVFGLLAIPVVLLRPKSFESVTTLLVFPPAFKNSSAAPATRTPSNQPPDGIAEMMPRAMPVEAYKSIALSLPLLDVVINKVPLEDTGIQAFRNTLEVELVQMGSRGSQGIMYAQTLVFHARAKSPELAATVARTWSEVFKDEVDGIAAKGVGETFALLDTLNSNTKAELEQAEIAFAEHRKAWNLELIKQQLDAKQKLLTEFEGNLKQTDVDLASGEMKLKALEDELAKEPKKEVYFRAPPDDAYWIVGLQSDGKPKIQPDQGLRTEMANENYVTTRTEGVKVKEDVEGLKAKRDTTLTKLDELHREITALAATLADKTVEQDKLKRESESLKASYAVVRAEYEKGRMANLSQASDIVIAGNAVTPRRPTGPSGTKTVLVAVLVGMFATGGFLLLKEISEMAPILGAGTGRLGALLNRGSGPAPDEPPAAPDAPKGEPGNFEKRA